VNGPASYPDLVTAVTIGLNQRPLPVTALAGPAGAHAAVLGSGDPAGLVLDAAALLTAARRAGLRARPAPLPGAALPDLAPELSPVASSVVASAIRGDNPALLADLLGAAAAAGFRAAAPVLPALLDAAVQNRSLHAAVRAVLGQRGRWLAAQRADWQRVAGGAATPAPDDTTRADLTAGAAPPGGTAPHDMMVWQTGRCGERRGWLAALRHADPAAARDLLAAGWRQETGADRETLLPVLAEQLSGADEPFLEAALDDRKSSVRRTAAGLLATLPGSAFNARAIARGAACLRVEGDGPDRRLAVAIPGPCDTAATRDGIEAAPPPGRGGHRAWLLTQFIAAVPLPEWSARLGLRPVAAARLPVAGGFRADVHAGWRNAAITQRDAAWAAALLAVEADGRASGGGGGAEAGAAGRGPGRAVSGWPAAAELASVLPPDARAARAVALLAEATVSPEAAEEISACPGPWPHDLAGEMLRYVAGGARWADRDDRVPPVPGRLLRAAARKIPAGTAPDYAAALRALARSAFPPGAWADALIRTADLVDLRRLFLQELQ
jgi:Family of unknown function (DUF5691)